MFDSLIEVVKAYSFGTTVKGNIISSPSGGPTGITNSRGTNPSKSLINDMFLSTYYRRMQEVSDYELTDLTNTTITIYKDYIIGYFSKTGKLITLTEKVPRKIEAEAKLNKIFKDLDIVGEVKAQLWNILYRGSFCFRVDFDKEKGKFVKSYLVNPHNVVTVKKGKDPICHLVVSKCGTIYKVKPEYIFRIGRADLNLINDLASKTNLESKEKDTLIKVDQMSAGTPLYYHITNKVREYLLKDQLLSLLSIKDLIQPLLLLVRLDKNTPIDEGNKVALNVENMINKYSDISSMLSSNYAINGLIDALMNNIRVIPDYQSALGDLNSVDLSKITSKIQEIENVQEMKKEAIFTSNSIPRALYNGDSTKWDAIKSSQRLNSKINYIVQGITESLKIQAQQFYKELYGIELDPDSININLFTKTEVDYNTAITNTDIIGQLVQGINQILSSCYQTMQEVKIMDPEKYVQYIVEQLKTVDPSIVEFLPEDKIKQAVLEITQQMQAGGRY